MLPQSKILKSNLSAEEQYNILSSGNVDLINKEEFLDKLKKKQSLKVKAGFDPSRPDMHIGHSVLIHKLCQFQELGHEVIFVVGDFTACIGDPSGQNKTRPALSHEEVQKNSQTYIAQATKKNVMISKELDSDSQKVLSFFKRLDLEKTKWVYNSQWFDELSLKKFILSISSKFTVARQLERNDFSQRYKAKKPIGLHEFFYPILQAYDSVALKADVEIGGTDQLFNLLLGRELQEEFGQSPQVVLTLPLLEGLDTKRQWEEIHELKTLLVYKKISVKEDIKEEEKNKLTDKLCAELAKDEDFKRAQISLNSIKLKFANNRYLDTKDSQDIKKAKGLKNYSKQNKEIFNQYKNYSVEELEKEIAKRKKETPNEINWNIEGGQKMSKSLSNAICFNDSPKDIYGKIMKISDDLLVNYWKVFTKGERDLRQKDYNSKEEKEKLAWLLVYSFYGEEQANHEKTEFTKTVSQGGLPDHIPEAQNLPPKKIKFYMLIKEIGWSSSSSEASRAILSGAVKREGKKITDPQAIIDLSQPKNKEFVLSFGKRKFKRVNLKWEEIHELKTLLVYKKISVKEDIKEEEKNKLTDKLCAELAKDEDFKRAQISLSSIKQKFENNRYLDTKDSQDIKKVKGLKNYSEQNNKIFNQYKNYSIEDLEKEIEKRQKKEN